MEPYVLTFDIGTQSIRGVLVRKDGSFLDTRRYSYPEPYFSKNPYYAEQTPGFYYDCLKRISRELLSAHPEVLPALRCVTVTMIRDTVLCLDENKAPLGDAIVWLDKREADYTHRLPLMKRLLFRLVGMLETVEYQYRDSKCNWLREKDPERWEKTAYYVYLSAYINYLMTGNLVDSEGCVVGHMPYDYKKRRWMKENDLTYDVYPVPREKLVSVQAPGSVIGKVTKVCADETLIPEGLPLIATGSDKSCETVGLSVRAPGSAALSFGTSATIQIATERYVEPRIFIPAYPAAIPGLYNPEIQIYRGYWMLSWFTAEFCQEIFRDAENEGVSVESILDRHLKDVPAGSGGLLIQPYWTAGVATPSARGSMVGFNDRQSKFYIYRAIIEGINFELMCAKKQLEKQSGTKIRELYVGGGGSCSPEVLQITADMFGLPVRCSQTKEVSSLGSSLIGFVSMGEFEDYESAFRAMVHPGAVYEPDPEKHAFYEKLFAVYEKLYGKLHKTYLKEKQIFRSIENV